MRFIEYLYLLFAILLTVYMAVQFQDLPTGNKVIMGLAIGLCAFMFSFRRKQRQVMEEADRERDKKLEEEAEEEDGH